MKTIDAEAIAIRGWLEAYLQKSQPIHWVKWVSKCPDPLAKKRLDFILFHGGCLRGLPRPGVRRKVLAEISQTPSIMELVIADFAKAMDKAHGQKK